MPLLRKVLQVGRRVDPHTAAVGILLAGQNPQQRRLPAPVRPQQPKPFPGSNLQRHPVQHRFGAEVLLHSFRVQKNHPRTLPFSLPSPVRPPQTPTILPQTANPDTTPPHGCHCWLAPPCRPGAMGGLSPPAPAPDCRRGPPSPL